MAEPTNPGGTGNFEYGTWCMTHEMHTTDQRHPGDFIKCTVRPATGEESPFQATAIPEDERTPEWVYTHPRYSEEYYLGVMEGDPGVTLLCGTERAAQWAADDDDRVVFGPVHLENHMAHTATYVPAVWDLRRLR